MTLWQRLLANRTTWTSLVILLLLVGGAWTWLGRVPTGSGPVEANGMAPRPGFLAPEFTLTGLDGASLSLADLEGKAVVLNFWATWCLPCRVEMPALERTWRNWQDRGLVVVAVNLQERPADVSAYVQDLGLSFPVVIDPSGSVFQQYRVQLYPTTFFIAPDGRIEDVVFGGPMAETLIASKAAELLED